MDQLEIIKKAIELRKPVEFEYNKEGKIRGKRIGNPHAIFKFVSGFRESIKTHIVQTDGVSDSKKPFPSFRMFNFEIISNAEILMDRDPFQIHEDYNPDWEGYADTIAKI